MRPPLIIILVGGFGIDSRAHSTSRALADDRSTPFPLNRGQSPCPAMARIFLLEVRHHRRRSRLVIILRRVRRNGGLGAEATAVWRHGPRYLVRFRLARMTRRPLRR